MKKIRIANDILDFASQEIVYTSIPKDFKTEHLPRLYNKIKSKETSIDQNDPMYKWLKKTTRNKQTNVIVFLLQVRKLTEEKIQDAVG